MLKILLILIYSHCTYGSQIISKGCYVKLCDVRIPANHMQSPKNMELRRPLELSTDFVDGQKVLQ